MPHPYSRCIFPPAADPRALQVTKSPNRTALTARQGFLFATVIPQNLQWPTDSGGQFRQRLSLLERCLISKQRYIFPLSSSENQRPWLGAKATAISKQAVRWGSWSLHCADGSNNSIRSTVASSPQSKALTPEQQKIQEWEARINCLERVKSI